MVWNKLMALVEVLYSVRIILPFFMKNNKKTQEKKHMKCEHEKCENSAA